MKRRVKKWLMIAFAWTLILGGIVLLPLPGPGVLVIAAGAYLLSRKSEWFRARMSRVQGILRRRWPESYRKLERTKEKARAQRRRVRELLPR